MNTKIILPLVGFVSLLAIAAVFVFRPLPTTITRENAGKLRKGMTLAEVEGVLGPPRYEAAWTIESYPRSVATGPLFTREPPIEIRRWVSESVVITVRSNPAVVDPMAKVILVEIDDHKFASTWDFVQWRVCRVLGLAPDQPAPVETDPPMMVIF